MDKTIHKMRCRIHNKQNKQRGVVHDRGTTDNTQKRKNIERKIFMNKRHKRRQKEQVIAVLSAEPHDAAYRRQVRTNKTKKANQGGCKYLDYTVCDVEHYHQRRLDNTSNISDDLHMRWMNFEQSYCTNGNWHVITTHKKPHAPHDCKQSTITTLFPRQATENEVQRALIALCKRDVWGDKLTHDSSMHTDEEQKGDNCPKCDAYMEKHRFEMVCSRCGYATASVMALDRNFKETEHVQAAAPSYKRKNHLNEWISRAQAAERKVVPLEIKNAVSECFSKWGIEEKQATFQLVRKFLKMKGFQRYFEHIPQIMAWLTKTPAPHMSTAHIIQIRQIFARIQAPFEKHKPQNRKNFLSYSYVLYKVCELLELDEFLPYFPLLKSRANLIKADSLWKRICVDCDFEFLATA